MIYCIVNRYARAYEAVASYLNVVWPMSCDCKHTAYRGAPGMLPQRNFFLTRRLKIASKAIFGTKKNLCFLDSNSLQTTQ